MKRNDEEITTYALNVEKQGIGRVSTRKSIITQSYRRVSVAKDVITQGYNK